MRISPVSFTGRREIAVLAQKCEPLNKDEQQLKAAAERFHDIEVIKASDGDWCSSADQKAADDFVLALATFRYQPSKFAYHTAVDVLGTQASRVENICDREYMQQTTREIAKHTESVTKEDLFRDWGKLS